MRNLALFGIHSSTISATQSALADSMAVSAATPTALTPAMLIRVDDGPLTLTAPAGQESVGARVTRLRKRAGREVLDVLTREGRAVHGTASVSQHESQA
ncbi:MAG: hypothetical protein ACE10G_09420 [Gemmatimonadales bacterium]